MTGGIRRILASATSVMQIDATLHSKVLSSDSEGEVSVAEDDFPCKVVPGEQSRAMREAEQVPANARAYWIARGTLDPETTVAKEGDSLTVEGDRFAVTFVETDPASSYFAVAVVPEGDQL